MRGIVTRLVGTALTCGILAGVALDVLTWLVARYGPEGANGQPWSFRGNGALIIPVGLGPAVLAGGWTALVLHYRSVARWRALSIGAAMIGSGLVLVGVVVLVGFGSVAQGASDWLSLAPLAWMVLAPLLARLLSRAGNAPPGGGLLRMGVGLIFAAALGVGFVSAGFVVSPGS